MGSTGTPAGTVAGYTCWTMETEYMSDKLSDWTWDYVIKQSMTWFEATKTLEVKVMELEERIRRIESSGSRWHGQILEIGDKE